MKGCRVGVKQDADKSRKGAAIIDWRDFTEDSLPPMLSSAVQTFVAHGYHGTSIRTLAAAANMSVAGLYHHFASKQSIIVAIMDHAMDELWQRSRSALAEAGADRSEQLGLLIECLALFHAHRKQLAFLASTEMRSLDPESLDRHIVARDRQERLLVDLLREGGNEGAFESDDPCQVARALTTMCTGISQWFDAAGPLSAASVAAAYVRYAQRVVLRRA